MYKGKFLKIMCLLALMALLPGTVRARLTLDECQRLAWQNYPLLKKYDLIRQATGYSIRNINRGYLPQLSFNGQATYQSDVAVLPSALTGVLKQNGYDYLGLTRGQYKLAIDLNQVIWDGGDLEAQKRATASDGEVQGVQTDVELYAIRERVNELYFGILLIEEKIRLNQDLQTLLQANCRKMENRQKHGTAMKSDVDVIKAECLKAEQEMTGLVAMKRSYQRMLALFVNKDAAAIEGLQKPDASLPDVQESLRPELRLFAARMLQADARERVLDAGLRPKLSLFAQGYYGYPGYDMFSDMFSHDWTLNGMVGVRLTWNIGRLYTHKGEKRKIDLARQQIETEQETFLFNNRLQSVQEAEAIGQYRRMMEKDEEIIALRTSVRTAAESKLEHGIIDVNDLLQEIVRENQARTDHSSHEVEMLKNIYELRHTMNR